MTRNDEVKMNPYDNAEALLRELAAPRRNQFFYGKRMDVQHFRMEQDYGRLKTWLLNRLTLGKGVLCGLQVALDGKRLVIDPGCAIDGLGREIVVPVRSVFDPAAARTPGEDGAIAGFCTLWLCYRECSTDFQPALVSDCGSDHARRGDCTPGTTVETFCFTLTPGLAPLQDDPRWCLPSQDEPPAPAPTPQPAPGQPEGPFAQAAQARAAAGLDAIRAALRSRRYALCRVTAADCVPDEQDACVPIAALLVDAEGPVAVENCLVRPRVYSNAMLADLILCLAQRIDACCPPMQTEPTLRVRTIEFLRRAPGGVENTVAAVEAPRNTTPIPVDASVNAIRFTFSRALAQGERGPTTAGPGDNDFKRHNVLVVPAQPLQGIGFVAGKLVVETPATLRFDLAEVPPYSRGRDLGWEKGTYHILLAGADAAAQGRKALAETNGALLDGEAAAPGSGWLSGDGAPGGNFTTSFTIG